MTKSLGCACSYEKLSLTLNNSRLSLYLFSTLRQDLTLLLHKNKAHILLPEVKLDRKIEALVPHMHSPHIPITDHRYSWPQFTNRVPILLLKIHEASVKRSVQNIFLPLHHQAFFIAETGKYHQCGIAYRQVH